MYSNLPSSADIDNRFGYHPATTDARKAEHEDVREACRALAHVWDHDLPAGREKALAITKIEEAMLWATAAIARQDPAR